MKKRRPTKKIQTKPAKDTGIRESRAAKRAMLARVKQIIDCLSGGYVVCEGWKMDEEAARRTLKYFTNQAKGAPDDDQEWGAACDFLYSHGQSIDWVTRGDPGVMICRRASESPRMRLLHSWNQIGARLAEQVSEALARL